jgi:hypothetical protein
MDLAQATVRTIEKQAAVAIVVDSHDLRPPEVPAVGSAGDRLDQDAPRKVPADDGDSAVWAPTDHASIPPPVAIADMNGAGYWATPAYVDVGGNPLRFGRRQVDHCEGRKRRTYGQYLPAHLALLGGLRLIVSGPF